MEAPDISSSGECSHASVAAAAAAIKRERTKRRRASSSVDLSATTEEEEDMAHCLILLARGRALDAASRERFTSRRFTEAAPTAAGGKAGFYVYECKTCSKCFPSFQALGGHRASHKRPKTAPVAAAHQEKEQCFDDIGNTVDTFSSDITIAPLPQPTGNSNNKHTRVHECSTCGAEFSSGQALGGHMRRHRPIGVPPPESHHHHHQQEAAVVKKERSVLSLDLNLPAPSDDNAVPVAFRFADKRPMVFSPTSALVDCHI